MNTEKKDINIGDQFLVPLESLKRISLSKDGFELVDTNYNKEIENREVVLIYIGDGMFENKSSRVKVNGFNTENTTFSDCETSINDYKSFNELFSEIQRYLEKPLGLDNDNLLNKNFDLEEEKEVADFLMFKNEYAKRDIKLQLKNVVTEYHRNKSCEDMKTYSK